MKVFLILTTLFLSLFSNVYNFAPKVSGNIPEKKMVIAIPSYNNEKYIQRNLDSVFMQNYTNYRVIYVDDCSKDETWVLLNEYIKKNNLEDLITMISNKKNEGAMHNHYMMAHMCQDDEIYVSLDGDDWFAHKNVLRRLNQAYADENVWVTYGSWKSYPSGEYGTDRQMIISELREGKHRDYGFNWTQLRTFYAKLFKVIPVRYFQDPSGNFFPCACDAAYMYNILDMARDHVYFIPDFLYVYNIETSINDYKKSSESQQMWENFIRYREPRLEKVEDWRNL